MNYKEIFNQLLKKEDKMSVYSYLLDLLYNNETKRADINKKDYLVLVENNRNVMNYFFLMKFIKNSEFLMNLNINNFEIYCEYIFFNTSYFYYLNIHVYRYLQFIKKFIKIYNYIYFSYIQVILNFIRIDFKYYYSFRKGKFVKYNFSDYETYKNIIDDQIVYVESCIDNYNSYVLKYFNRYIDFIIYTLEQYDNKKCYKCIFRQSNADIMYKTTIQYIRNAKMNYKILENCYIESQLLLNIENDNYKKHLETFENLTHNIYICENEYNNDKNTLYKIFMEQLSHINPKYFYSDILEDFDIEDNMNKYNNYLGNLTNGYKKGYIKLINI
jgi:hypothetical protein